MTSVAGVRVLPESLAEAWEKLHAAWAVSPDAQPASGPARAPATRCSGTTS